MLSDDRAIVGADRGEVVLSLPAEEGEVEETDAGTQVTYRLTPLQALALSVGIELAAREATK